MEIDVAQIITAASAIPLGYLGFRLKKSGARDTAKLQEGANRVSETRLALLAQKSIAKQYKDQAEYEHNLRLAEREEFEKDRRQWNRERDYLARMIRNEVLKEAAMSDDSLQEMITDEDDRRT